MSNEEKGVTCSTRFIGFTGLIGSGCTFFAKTIEKIYGYKYYKLSDIIKDHLGEDIERGANDYIEKMQNKGNELRFKKGPSFLVDKTLLKIYEDLKSVSNIKGIIIDGIKNESEIQALKFVPNFYLFSIHADKIIRSNRLSENKTFADFAAFEKSDKRDFFEDNANGQQVKRCDYLSDIILINNSFISDASKKSAIINKISRYFDAINETKKIKPSKEELCMVISYSTSKMSSCMNRKVGAIITHEHKVKNIYDADGKQDDIIDNYKLKKEERHLEMPVIISSGYNDVPLGLHNCLHHPSYQGCYRDFLKKNHVEKFNYCPNCGKDIEDKINKKYVCECGKNIFEEYIPGAKNTPGKLLDMCRALHAEEVALLNLIRNSIGIKELTLYTTTQPCNLCANKIVNVGIRKVIFSEPYTMKESEEILLAGGVEVKRFEGIKSDAFFRLYNQERS